MWSPGQGHVSANVRYGLNPTVSAGNSSCTQKGRYLGWLKRQGLQESSLPTDKGHSFTQSLGKADRHARETSRRIARCAAGVWPGSFDSFDRQSKGSPRIFASFSRWKRTFTRPSGASASEDGLRAELAEIDENLIHNELTVLERGEHLAGERRFTRRYIRKQRHIAVKSNGNDAQDNRGKQFPPVLLLIPLPKQV